MDTPEDVGITDRLWDRLRRAEVGAAAEEAVGRFLALLPSWRSDIEIYHSVEFRGRGLPRGDIDHLVVTPKLSFALAIETKFRLYDDEIPNQRDRIIEYAAAAEQVTGWWTYPVLCQAAAALTDDEDEYIIVRHFEAQGRVLLADATNIATAIMWIVTRFDSFRDGEPVFPEHRTRIT